MTIPSADETLTLGVDDLKALRADVTMAQPGDDLPP